MADDVASRAGAPSSSAISITRQAVPDGDAGSSRNGGISYPVVDRRHMTLVLQEFSEVDETLAKYLGPNHTARKELARLMNDLREKLG